MNKQILCIMLVAGMLFSISAEAFANDLEETVFSDVAVAEDQLPCETDSLYETEPLNEEIQIAEAEISAGLETPEEPDTVNVGKTEKEEEPDDEEAQLFEIEQLGEVNPELLKLDAETIAEESEYETNAEENAEPVYETDVFEADPLYVEEISGAEQERETEEVEKVTLRKAVEDFYHYGTGDYLVTSEETISEDLIIPLDFHVTVEGNGVLTIDQDATLWVEGTLTVQGYGNAIIRNNGTIFVSETGNCKISEDHLQGNKPEFQVVKADPIEEEITEEEKGEENEAETVAIENVFEDLFLDEVSFEAMEATTGSGLSVVSADTGSPYPDRNVIKVAYGGTTTLRVTTQAEDLTQIEYLWGRIWTKEDGTEQQEMLDSISTSLTTGTIDRAYLYICAAKDQNGTIARCYFRVTVENHLSVVSPVTGSKWRDSNYINTSKGSTATLSVKVTADDTSNLRYQWYRSTDLNQLSSSVIVENGITGTVTTEPVTQSIVYWCAVTDRYGTTENCYFTVQVDNHLSVACADGSLNQWIYRDKNEAVTLTAYVTADDRANLNYQWYKGEYADLNPPLYLIEGANTAILQADNSEKAMMYRCSVTDRYGNIQSCWYNVSIQNHLTVTPAVGTLHNDTYSIVTVDRGNSATLKVKVTGDNLNNLRYEWRERINAWTTGAEYSSPLQNQTSNTLQTGIITESKYYRCAVYDCYGGCAICNFQVSVNNNVTITSITEQNPLVVKGTEITMKVSIAADDMVGISVQWKKIEKENGVWKHTIIEGATGTSCKALITDNVEYVCNVTDKYGGEYSISFQPAITEFTNQTPVLKSVENTPQGIKLTWNAVNGTVGYYRILRRTATQGWSYLYHTTDTTYTDTTVVNGTEYSYYLVAGWGGNTTPNSNTITIIAGNNTESLATPTLSGISNVNGGVKISWNVSAGAEKYRVFRKEGGGSWAKLKDVTTTSYTDKTAESGKTYSYTVRCISADGKKYTSAYNRTGLSIKYVAAPELSTITLATNGVKITWKGSAGAEKYRVYRKEGSGSWSKVGDTTGTSYTDKTALSGTTYSYTVRCISAEGKTTSAYNKTGLSITYIAAPVLSSVKAVTGGVKVTWKASTGAEKYRVFRKTGSGSWTKLGDTTKLSYTDKTVKGGTTYSYTVRCINSTGKSYTSAYNKTGKSITVK